MDYLNKAKKALPLIGIILFIYILYLANPLQILIVLYSANIKYILLALAMLIPIYYIIAIKWDYILKHQGFNISKSSLANIVMMAEFWGVITPGKLGTFMRIKYLSDLTKSKIIKCSSSVVLDRFADLFVAVGIATIGSFFLVEYFSKYRLVLLVSLVVSVFLVALFSRKHLTGIVANGISAITRNKINLDEAVTEFYHNFPKLKQIVVLILLTGLMWMLTYIAEYFIALSLGINLPVGFFVISQAIALTFVLIPITINGLGTKEAVLIALFSIFNISAGATVAFSLLVTVLLMIVPACIGGTIVFKLSRTLKG